MAPPPLPPDAPPAAAGAPARPALALSRRAALGAALCLGAPRVALADAVDDALRDVTKAREKLRSLACPFTQERVLGLLATKVTSRGDLTLVRPDRLRWHLEPPDEATYWVTPEGVAYRSREGGGKAGNAGPWGAMLGDLLVALGGDLARLRARYAIAAERPADGLTLTLTPKAPEAAKLLRSLRLTLAPDLLSPSRLVLEEPGDDRATIVFGPAKLNAPVDPSRLKPPA
ncbi:MAG TPA: outer membrane lipoprotein carrier protein LolA [Polyangiaceae bacterium]|nr:outer membrane lipoprotein carrier protein LolA [Polyangiaceae bacterium]